jgi:hypothetical protein
LRRIMSAADLVRQAAAIIQPGEYRQLSIP